MPLDRPAIRPLDVQRVENEQGRGIMLSDRLGISEPTFIPEQLLPIVGRCTGECSLVEIRQQADPQYDDDLTEAFVSEVVNQLDERLLLIGERFENAVSHAAKDFLETGVRAQRHAGSAGYPAAPVALRQALDALVRPRGPDPRHLRGLIAPHIDLARGAQGYTAAYERLLTAPPADLYVIFGTGHAGPTAPVSGLILDWQTPLGTTRTDREFVDAVHERIGAPSAGDLLHHRDEHSLEFQVLFLQHLHSMRGATTELKVACFLCGSLPSSDGDPMAEDYAQTILAAFRAAEDANGGRVCYIAGADLAHIGPFFGDPEAVSTDRLEQLATVERERLALLEEAQPGPFHRAVEQRNNPDRVCSAPAITLCAALADGPGELLHYGQARAEDHSQTVTFCAMAFTEQAH